ncbi:hypothetical protein WSM22_11720 [Cytophagales bacterium WSM2-2]|nr:hypothetical protein WSM22_11720 [Cytophagales bacterium WSM2-2]
MSAQDQLRDSLYAKLAKAQTPASRLQAYYNLADTYFDADPQKSDSLAFLGQATAEGTRDRKLIVRAYLRDATRFLRNNPKGSYIEKSMERLQKALAISRSERLSESLVECEIILARCYRIRGEIAKAIAANNEAVATLPEIHNDSLSVMAYNSLGLSLVNKNDMVAAFKAYLAALTLAEQTKNSSVLVICYDRLMDFYLRLKNQEKAKDYAFKIREANASKKDSFLAIRDLIRIGQVYSADKDLPMAKFYFEKAAHIADSMKAGDYKVEVKLGLVNMYIGNNRFKEGYNLILKSPEIFAYIKRIGLNYEIDKANGYFQMMLGRYDSSDLYYKRAELFYKTDAAPVPKYNFYDQYCLLFKTTKQWDKAIAIELKAKQAIETTGNIELLATAVQTLDSLYLMKGDFTTAYRYHNQYQLLHDSLQKLSKEKDLQSLEIENENKRKERETAQAEEDLRRRHNLQYMAITVVIGGIFILLVAFGLFKVSTGVVKAMGFFAFIFLFEFITLIADKQIHHLTHGEPWKILMIKIVLVAGMLPLHHWLEEKVIHYIMQKHGAFADRLKKWKGSDSPA